MKLFHLSDLHIGIKLFNKDLKKDQEYVFQQIVQYAQNEQPDVIIIAGDIYDRAIPSAEAVDTFDDFISKLVKAVPDCEILVISGNHDNASRLNIFRKILESNHVHMIGMPPIHETDRIEKVVLQDKYGDVNFYLLPFVKPSMVKEITGLQKDGTLFSYHDAVKFLIAREHVDVTKRNVFVSHQLYLPPDKKAEDIERMDSEIFRTVGNIDEIKADVLEVFDYSALGHIHKPMKVGSETIRYCGTPMPYSISEANQQKGIIMVELGEKGNVITQTLPLKPLHEVRIVTGKLDDLIQSTSDDYVRIVLTDEENIDFFDMQDRIYAAYPNVLEIQRQTKYQAKDQPMIDYDEALNPYELCERFLGDISEEDKEILKEIMNQMSGGDL